MWYNGVDLIIQKLPVKQNVQVLIESTRFVGDFVLTNNDSPDVRENNVKLVNEVFVFGLVWAFRMDEFDDDAN